jgi:tetratricopeptide (TPR) repeat protein
MPLYKRIEKRRKKGNELPFYRPIDRLFLFLWGRRKTLAPLAAVLLLTLLAYGGLRYYASRYETGASLLLGRGELREAAERYPRSKAAMVARLKLGREAIEGGKYDEAVAWYLPVVEKGAATPLLRSAAFQNLALAYLKKGETDRALEILEKSAADPGNVAPDYARLLLAKVYESKGDGDKALEIYKSLAEGASSGLIRQEAKDKVAWFESQKK